ncbi:mitogen-activated protein kinase kinase kinase kinase 5-like [Amblyraja radiata]|uniref:mitogen-activated protein kinase kinase kinase kinase 5-like n=1 Tax=Amblyraja radiata TaxID=386614 RepID=UPI00140223FA|nr:mitogen-activated protein kinase kinase kinase kinase 5-like [Amblyraja radiata]
MSVDSRFSPPPPPHTHTVRNPYTRDTFLCGALENSIILMQWYEPLQKFLLLKQFSLTLPNPLRIFELLVFPGEEYPQVCLGVRGPSQHTCTLQFQTVKLCSSGTLIHHSCPGTHWPWGAAR